MLGKLTLTTPLLAVVFLILLPAPKAAAYPPFYRGHYGNGYPAYNMMAYGNAAAAFQYRNAASAYRYQNAARTGTYWNFQTPAIRAMPRATQPPIPDTTRPYGAYFVNPDLLNTYLTNQSMVDWGVAQDAMRRQYLNQMYWVPRLLYGQPSPFPFVGGGGDDASGGSGGSGGD